VKKYKTTGLSSFFALFRAESQSSAWAAAHSNKIIKKSGVFLIKNFKAEDIITEQIGAINLFRNSFVFISEDSCT
jgi:hypothetical protein